MSELKPELLPCPFCGAEAKVRSTDHYEPYHAPVWICCTVCNGSATSYATIADAAEAWNRRALPSTPLSALLSLFPDLPADATAETVLDRVREGERARRAWECVETLARKGMVAEYIATYPTSGEPCDEPWAISYIPTYHKTALELYLAAVDAQGGGK